MINTNREMEHTDRQTDGRTPGRCFTTLSATDAGSIITTGTEMRASKYLLRLSFVGPLTLVIDAAEI